MKRCPSCGQETRDDSQEFCTRCGAYFVTGHQGPARVGQTGMDMPDDPVERGMALMDVGSFGEAVRICVLDTSELEDQIEKAKESLSETAEQAQSNYDQALASFQTASDEAAQAEAAYASAQTAYNTALTNFQNAQSTVGALQDAYDAAQAKADAAAAAVAEKLNAYTAAKAAGTGVEEALAALNAANQTYEGCDWGGVGTGGLKAEAEAALSALNSGKNLCGYNELEQALNTAAQALREQQRSFIIFPEGTRSRGRQVGEFKSGGFRVALKNKAPIVPVAIEGTYQAMEAHHMWIHPAQVKVRILPAVYTQNLTPEEGKTIGEIVRQRIVEAKEEMETVPA